MGGSSSKNEEGSSHENEISSSGGMHLFEIHSQSVGVSLAMFIFLVLFLVVLWMFIRRYCLKPRCATTTTSVATATSPTIAYEMAPIMAAQVDRLKHTEPPATPTVRLIPQPTAPVLPSGVV